MNRFILFFLVILSFRCKISKDQISKQDIIGTCEGNHLDISISHVNIINTDDVSVEVEFNNKCMDTLIIMNGFTNIDFRFTDSSIKKRVMVNTTSLYPEIEWSKGYKKYYLECRCQPSLGRYQTLIIPPNNKVKKITI